MTALTFYVPGRPRSQGSKIPGRRKDGGLYMRESDPNLPAWRKAVRAAALDAVTLAGLPKVPYGDGPVGLVLTFGFRRPKSSTALWPISTIDVDKAMRAVGDALTRVLYVDDKQIVSATIRKVWAEIDVPWAEGMHVWCNHTPGYVSALE